MKFINFIYKCKKEHNKNKLLLKSISESGPLWGTNSARTKQLRSIKTYFNLIIQGKTVNITTDAVTSLTIKFDQAIPKSANQKDFFNLFSEYIPKIPEGYNLTVFAYGQTGSGKTHTMFGSDWEYTITKNAKSKQQQNTFFEDL